MSPRTRDAGLWLGLFALQLLHAGRFVTADAPGTGAAWTGFPLDDAFIHLVYAESLSLFEGFDYNPGQPEAGFTSPLWALLLAPVFWLTTGLDGTLVAGVKLLGVVLASVASGLAALITRRITGSFAAALAAGVLVAAEPHMSWAGVSGMEVSLASVTLLLPLWLLANDRIGAALAALALAPLARPESAVVAVVALPILADRYLAKGGSLAGLFAWLLPIATAGTAWLAYCQGVTGRPLPSTFYVKSLDTANLPMLQGVLWNLRSIGSVLASSPLFGYGAGALAAGLGAATLLRGFARHPSAGVRAASLLSVLTPIAWLAGIAVAHRLADPDYYYWSRYVHPVLPLFGIWLACGAWALLGGRPEPAGYAGPRSTQRSIAGLLATLVAVLVTVSCVQRGGELTSLYAWNCQNMNEVQVALGRWIDANTDPSDVVATVDAGAIRFVGRRTTVDMVGLNSHEILSGGRDALVRADPRYVAAFRGSIEQALAVRWQLVERKVATSRHYTVSGAPIQASIAIYEVTNRWSDAAAESRAR